MKSALEVQVLLLVLPLSTRQAFISVHHADPLLAVSLHTRAAC